MVMADPSSATKSPTLFRGQYVFRSRNGTLAMILPLLVCIVCVAIAVQAFREGAESPVRVVGSAFAIGALVFGGLGLYVLFSWIGNKCERVQIDDEGVTHRNRFTPWSKIRSFHGTRFDNGICLGHMPIARFFWGDGSLPTTPLLTEQEYVDLARRLHSRIGHRFPNVIVYMHPVEPTGGS